MVRRPTLKEHVQRREIPCEGLTKTGHPYDFARTPGMSPTGFKVALACSAVVVTGGVLLWCLGG